jgi:hypothetical protein
MKSIKRNKCKLEYYMKSIVNKEELIQIVLKSNECIYIPEGYWHYVRALSNNCVSINYWLDGVLTKIDNNEKYLLRFCMQNLLEKAGIEFLNNHLKYCK